MLKPFYLLILIPALVTGGCTQKVYEVDMKPQGKSMERKLTYYLEGSGNISITFKEEARPATPAKTLSSVPQERLNELARIYGVPAPETAAEKFTFEGTFEHRLPDDLGCAGYYNHFVSPLGTASVYMERFRGATDLAGALEEAMASADRLVDHFIGWLETRLSQEKDWAVFRSFLDDPFRRDFKNLLLELWLIGNDNLDWTPSEDEENNKELVRRFSDSVARILIFLAERDYFAMEDLPRIARMFTRMESEKDSETMKQLKEGRGPVHRTLREMLARKLGLSEESGLFDRLFDLIAEEEKEKTFEAYLRTTKEWEAQLALWEGAEKDDPDLEEPDPRKVTEDLAEKTFAFAMPAFGAFGGAWLFEPDMVTIRIGCEEEPLYSNGHWDKDRQVLTWSSMLFPDQKTPVHTFGTWAVPSATFQEMLFGRVLLEKEDLIQYVIWYEGLDEEETKEWDAFLLTLNPSMDLKGAIESFLFSWERKAGEPSAGELKKSLAHTARKLLLEALANEVK
jgi:hypothetical protein